MQQTVDEVIDRYSVKVSHWSLVVLRRENVEIPLGESHSLIFYAISGF